MREERKRGKEERKDGAVHVISEKGLKVGKREKRRGRDQFEGG